MNVGEQTTAGGYCKSCGAPFGSDARFCRDCGAPRKETPSGASQPTVAHSNSHQPRASTPPEASAQPVDGTPAPPGSHPASQAGYPTVAPGYQPPPGYAGYAGQPPGYPAPPQGGYATPAAGYPVQQGQLPLPQPPEQRSTNSRWLIGGIAAAVVAIVGIGVAVVLATGGSGTPTRLVAVPVVTGSTSTSTSTSTPAPSPAAQAPPTTHSSTPRPSTPTVGKPAIATTPRATISQQVDQQQAVENTIHQEFALISEHKFSAAYALLAPSLQTGEAGWVQSHREEGIYNVSVATSATIHSPESATASIVSMRTLDGGGCKNWTGSWDLIKIDGQWRISEANLTPGSC
jgi:hypothetical protein